MSTDNELSSDDLSEKGSSPKPEVECSKIQAGAMVNNHSTVIKNNSRFLMVRYLIEER